MAEGRRSISIVIPVFNEAAILERSVREIIGHVGRTGMTWDMILVDDGSEDDTWRVIENLAAEYRSIRGVRFSRNFGKEQAMSAGLAYAGGDAVVVMDADLQHPPELMPEMVRRWRDEGWDIVEAVKADRGYERWHASARAGLFYWLMKRLSGLDMENASDFKLLDRRVVDAYNSLPEYTRFFRGIVSWLGFRREQVPFTVGEGLRDETRWTLVGLIRLAVNASTAFTTLPLHFVTALGIVTFFVSILLGVHTLYMKFAGKAVTGFTTVILLLLFIGSILMFSLGIIGIYLSRIYDEVKRRPKYIIRSILNMGGP